ncbi:MAG: MMPL family transporter [Thermodesulfobacteriota bacterium]|nr:MMPL family transporter [Thermodesulfobacteriota bacterium]
MKAAHGRLLGEAEKNQMKLVMTNFSMRHPWVVVMLVLAATLLLATQFPKAHFDNDPENMLAEDEHVRILHHEVKKKYRLYDFVIVGIVNEKHPDGVFNVETLGRIYDLTSQLLSLSRSADGKPSVIIPGKGAGKEERIVLDLAPESPWKRALAFFFRQNPNRLFGERGHSAIISREIISPSVVDNIKQADLGSLKLEYLMEEPPSTREEALTIRADAMANPLYSGTLVAEDEKAICIYIPIVDKTYSYNVANLVRALTEDWEGEDKIYITGLPVAEDTFGVEMLVQMATSAPMAGLAIFLLLLLFFRRISLIIAPMIVAVVCVLCTMGLLIGLGFDVHIMSSMIAIFLMPIAVADAVHILSEFFDTYEQFKDKAKTLQHVIGHLFMPMLYTTLTTIAGFASLATTPIPPVQVFGLHVAFGVALAWLLTMTLIPAYIIVAVPDRSLARLGTQPQKTKEKTLSLNRILEGLGSFSYIHWKLVLSATVLVIAVSVYGISRIQVNDNPVKWFTTDHPIRMADTVLNAHFGGTYTAYLTFSESRPERPSCMEKAAKIRAEAKARLEKALPEATAAFIGVLDGLKQRYQNVSSSNVKKCFVDLVNEAKRIDAEATQSWYRLADTINYLDPEGLTYERLAEGVEKAADVKPSDKNTLLSRLEASSNLKGYALLDTALAICDEFTALSFREFVFEMEAELTAPLFKTPALLRYIEQLQDHLTKNPVVGKTSSAVDALKKASYELSYVSPPSDATEAEKAAFANRNLGNFSIPDSVSAVGQVFTQLEGMKKKDSLFHLVTKDYSEANVWVQLKSGDNKDMEDVVADVTTYMAENPPPVKLTAHWAGLTYLNVVWQDKMVRGMLSALGSSFIVVLVMMMLLFRSPLYGLLCMIPLSVTIAFIYGLIGLVGKDYDMPVAVLSALTLGLSVDFAIHFLERARETQKALGSWKAASAQMFKEPAMAISRNAIVISVGFTPLLMAPLVPYKTVGFFLATIMAVSWCATLFILPALVTTLRGVLFKTEKQTH